MENLYDKMYGQFAARYELVNPAPVFSAIRLLGWQFFLSLIWAIASVFMVSSQTASEFYHAKVLSGMEPGLAIAASTMVLVAVEGGLIIGAAIRAARNRKYNDGFVVFALFVCVIISIVAGINSSLGLVDTVGTEMILGLRILLVFTFGVGGSLTTLAAGEVLGAQLARAFLDRDKAFEEFQGELDRYYESMKQSWTSSPEYTIAMADTRDQATDIQEYRKSRKSAAASQPTVISDNGHYTNYKMIPDEIKEQFRFMTSKEIMDNYGTIQRTADNWINFSKRDFGEA